MRRRDPSDKLRVTLDRPATGTVEHAVERLFDTAGTRGAGATTALLRQLIALLEGELRTSRIVIVGAGN